MVKVFSPADIFTSSDPEVDFPPDQPPDAVHDDEFVDDQFIVTASPFEADEEVALKLIDGPGMAGGAELPPPPPPPQEAIKINEIIEFNIFFIRFKFSTCNLI